QLRTIAMDFWASTEHKLSYKYRRNLPAPLRGELDDAARVAAELDARMERLRDEIRPLPPELADLPGPRLLTARPVACSDRGHSTAHNGDMAHSTRSRRVLITGATGGVGSHLASTLAEEYEL